MKIFMCFRYADYYPNGGVNDFQVAGLSLVELQEKLESIGNPGYSNEDIVVFDTDTLEFRDLRDGEK